MSLHVARELAVNLHRDAENRNQFFLARIFLILDRNWLIFSHTLSKVYATISFIYFWHALRILRNNEIETFNVLISWDGSSQTAAEQSIKLHCVLKDLFIKEKWFLFSASRCRRTVTQ